MSKENKHLKRNLLVIGLTLILVTVAVADCDSGIFPSTPQKNYGSIFDPSGGNVFMVTPFLEDCKNSDLGKNWGWTSVGDGTLYYGSGFDRPDKCKFSCDAKRDGIMIRI